MHYINPIVMINSITYLYHSYNVPNVLSPSEISQNRINSHLRLIVRWPLPLRTASSFRPPPSARPVDPSLAAPLRSGALSPRAWPALPSFAELLGILTVSYPTSWLTLSGTLNTLIFHPCLFYWSPN